MRDTGPGYDGGVAPGEDWLSADGGSHALRATRQRRGFLTLNRSPLARKIITFNLIGLLILIAGVFYLNPFRDSLAAQRSAALQTEAQLIADVLALQLPAGASALTDGPAPIATLERLSLSRGVELHLFDAAAAQGAAPLAHLRSPLPATTGMEGNTVITNFLNTIWEGMSRLLSPATSRSPAQDADALTRGLVPEALSGATPSAVGRDAEGDTLFSVATPVMLGDRVLGVIAVTSAAGEIDALVRTEREQVLQMFVVAILVSIGLSLVLASTIANPLSDLAAAAEIGRDRNTRQVGPSRVRIPDLSGRPDEIGRLSGALRGMVAALYDRIDANEQFAADVAHEIKNPLASLRSAVGTMRIAKREDQRKKLLDVIDHDVRRLDRLVSDISNASRLDSELVKEEETAFNLLNTLENLSDFLGSDARRKGVEFIADMPPDPIRILGLEARLAQVFVNLITNAISFCETGDAVRIWVRKRDNRVLVVVEDTGPGIPDQALTKIFNRFYSERPVGQFGNHSGLGLAISKQIVEAHGGVIWAENIRPTETDPTSDPLGARFVVGLPL